jgi:hypothetical protein
MAPSATLCSYLQGFSRANQAWAPPPTVVDPRLRWWRELPWHTSRSVAWSQLCQALPQLRLPQQAGISRSDLYRQSVLRGASPADGPAPLQQPECLCLQVAVHPYLAMPVLSTPNHRDFIWLVRALAHRGEPVPIESGVHAQAISGLIHWGLIRALGPEQRASLIVLHEATYGSLPAEQVPGGLDHHQWLQASGQLLALGAFSATLFTRCLQQRWRAYVPTLPAAEAEQVHVMVQRRAHELELALGSWHGPAALAARAQLLPWLCRLRLDQQIQPTAPPPLAASPEA